MKKEHILHFAVTLLGLTIIRIWWQGKLVLYVHPSTEWFVALGGAVIVAVSLLWSLQRTTHFHIPKSQIVSALLIVCVLAFGKNVSLSPSLAKQRQSGESIPQVSRSAAKLGSLTGNFNVLEWWMAWEGDPAHQKYLGSSVEVTGFILRDGGSAYVARMLLTCCAVDAQPVQIEFQSTQDTPAENAWVKITGTMSSKDGKPFIIPTSINTVDEPTNPYVY